MTPHPRSRGLGVLAAGLAIAALLGGPAACGTTPRGAEPRPAALTSSRLLGPAEIAGSTVDAATGRPLAGVVVTGPGGREVTSDEHGRFLMKGLKEGTRGELVARSSDGRTARNRLRPLRATRLEVVLHLR